MLHRLRNILKKTTLKCLIAIAVCSALLGQCLTVFADFADEITLYQKSNSFPVTKGVTYQGKTLFTSAGWQNIHVLTIDLTANNIDIDTLIGKDGLSARAPLSQMVSESGAVAGINGDFFVMATPSAPIGGQVSGGKLVSSPSNRQDMASFVLTADGIPQILRMEFSGKVIAPNGSSFEVGGVNKIGDSYSKIFIFTPDFGKSTPSPAAGSPDLTFAIVKGGRISQILNGRSIEIPENGLVFVGRNGAADFLKMNFSEGDYVELDLKLTPDISNLKMALGGGAVLLQNGQIPASFSHNVAGTAPRTAVGFSSDKKTMYLVVVDGRLDISRGMTQKEMAQLMLKLGASDALNLDGGGSSTMVVRPLGEKNPTVINRLSEGVQRLIANGLGIFTNAPQGKVYGLKIVASAFNVPKGGSRSFEVRAYDENYNPLDIDQSQVKWSVSNGLGVFNGNVLKASSSGYGQVTASYAGITASQEIMVMNNAAKLSITPDKIQLNPGASSFFEVIVTDEKGYKAPLEAADINWQVTGNIGTFEGSYFKAGTASASGAVTAAFSGLKATALVHVGSSSQLLEDFEKSDGKHFSSYPATVTGAFSVTAQQVRSGSFSGRLDYDFTVGDESRAAYMNFTKNLALPVGTQKLSLWVYGQGQGHWLRGTIQDASGQEFNIDFAKEVNWTGWQRVEASLPKGKEPFSLKRIYLVEIDPAVKNAGTVYFDDLAAIVSSTFDHSLLPQTTLSLDKANTPASGTFSFGAFGNVLLSNSYSEIYKKTFNMAATLFNQKKTALNVIAGKPTANGTPISGLSSADMLKNYKTAGAGYSVYSHNDVLFITLNSTKGGLRQTDYNQWLKLQKDLDAITGKTKTVFVVMDRAPEQFTDALEGDLLKKVLSDCVKNKGVNLWVLSGSADRFDSYMENGVHFVKVPGVDAKEPAAALFSVSGDKVYYQVIPLIERIEASTKGVKKGIILKLDVYGISPAGNKIPLAYPYAVDWKLSSDKYGSLDKNTMNFNASQTGELTMTVKSGGASLTFTLSITDITVKVNGKEVVFPDQVPYINKNGRTMVPVRFVSESLGANVGWNFNTKTVTIQGAENIIKLKLGESKALVNDKAVAFDTKAEMKNDRVMVPLRFVSEVLGANVVWNNNTRTVEITK